jgi:Na+-translocating ferredoxin:NAD+ oxidoreductase subunit B
MGTTILYTILSLSILGVIAAIILYIVAQKFMIIEDPRIDIVTEALPSANCGGCGFAGCRNFAENCVNSEILDGLYCPVGGNVVMKNIAELLGRVASDRDPRIAVLRCNGSCQSRPVTNLYDGASSCAIASALYGGNTDCHYGCISLADCVDVCIFDAIKMDPFTGLPVINDLNCTACGACVKACPKNLIELRKRAKKERKIYIACCNEDKGVPAKKSCNVACIGCGKCVKICPHEAITMNNNLAFIDSDKCKLCRKCTTECPTNSIIEIGFPEIKDKNPDVIVTATNNGLSDNQILPGISTN